MKRFTFFAVILAAVRAAFGQTPTATRLNVLQLSGDGITRATPAVMALNTNGEAILVDVPAAMIALDATTGRPTLVIHALTVNTRVYGELVKFNGNHQFQLSRAHVPGTLIVYRNGIRQLENADFTRVADMLTSAPYFWKYEATDKVLCDYDAA